MPKPPDPDITAVVYTTVCDRKDKKPLPHSLRYTSDMTDDILTERWRCRNCPTELIRLTDLSAIIHPTPPGKPKVWDSAGRPIG